jgi:hypothetical protein
MSWMIGYIGENINKSIDRISKIHAQAFCEIKDTGVYIAAGGNKNNCFFSKENKWIVTGIGIELHDNYSESIDEYKWQRFIKENSIYNLEGHFIITTCQNNRVKFHIDKIGLRSLYYLRVHEGVYFSTKLNWLCEILGKTELDFEEFGSRWLLYNQLSHNSFIKGIEKLPPGSETEICNGVVSINNIQWHANIKKEGTESELLTNLQRLIKIKLPSNLVLSLGLSGGMDSRFLLSQLLREEIDFKLHCFGLSTEADVIVAKKIARSMGLNINYIESGQADYIKGIDCMSDYISFTQLSEPPFSCFKLNAFNDQYFGDKFIIDGVGGEFLRRQFLNRLIIHGRSKLLNKDVAAIFHYLKVSKPKIFKTENEKLMYEGCLKQLDILFNEFPDPAIFGPENFVDLLILKYKLPNYFGGEQNRLDSLVSSFMPLTQLSFFESAMSLPIGRRKSGKFVKQTIKNISRELGNFNLVKSGVYYPFNSPSLPSHIYVKIRNRITNNRELNKINFYKENEIEIKDIFSSQSFKEYGAYDIKNVELIIRNFYEKKRIETVDELDWLLGFELMRRELKINQ